MIFVDGPGAGRADVQVPNRGELRPGGNLSRVGLGRPRRHPPTKHHRLAEVAAGEDKKLGLVSIPPVEIVARRLKSPLQREASPRPGPPAGEEGAGAAG